MFCFPPLYPTNALFDLALEFDKYGRVISAEGLEASDLELPKSGRFTENLRLFQELYNSHATTCKQPYKLYTVSINSMGL